jgi:hypothetical protein
MSRSARPTFSALAFALAATFALTGCSGGGKKGTNAPATCAATGASCATLPCCTATNVCAGSLCATPATCQGTGSSCGRDADCCVSFAGACANAPGGKVCTLPATCAGTGSACAADGDCCNPFAGACAGAPGSKVCTAPATCAGTGATCSPPSVPCCNAADACSGSVCTAPATCAATGSACSGTVPCCNGADSCVDPDGAGPSPATCVPPAICAATSGACSPSVPCCSASDSCTGGTCVPPPTCGKASAPCLTDGDCCLGLACPATGGTRTCQVPACAHLSGACTVPGDCCTGEGLGCAGNVCVGSATCYPAGHACTGSADCCTNACANHVCTDPSNVCKQLSDGCTAGKDCCSGFCDTSGGAGVCASPTVSCGQTGDHCTSGADCCSAFCTGPAGAATCTAAAFCKPAGGACLSSGECCSLSCASGTCAGTSCRQQGASCTTGSECCTGLCDPVAVGSTVKACAALPGGNGCRSLADSCTVGAGDCCSKNCLPNAPGATQGTCVPAYTCHAYYDICFRNEECCSGVCDTSLSSPGRCKQMPGACTQDGNPCSGSSNCCTRLCQDLGSGVAVCQPAAGCRMTGDYCDRTQACCGGSPDALHPIANPYGVFCDTAGRDNRPPRNDSSTKDDYRCTNGTSCNPPGNICGGSGAVNASQNCCDGKKAVCKPDSNGVYRCFGGCPNDDCSKCKTGYDPNDPACCIPAADPANVTTANVCQFSDQCCGGAPCVPDAVTGVLHCTRPPGPSCTPKGGECAGVDANTCCAPTTCQYDGSGATGYHCALDTTACAASGAACAGDAACCSLLCRDGGTGPKCVACVPNALSCTAPGQCCSGICRIPLGATVGTCGAACQPDGGTCTQSGDCCTESVCNIPAGATSGTCGPVQACAPNLYDACNDALPCCTGTCYADPAHNNFAPCPGPVSGCACGE